MIEQIFPDDIMTNEVTFLSCMFKLLLSMFLGAMVGLERKHKGQKAGIRTFALIAMGATLAMLVSLYIPQEYFGMKNGDPGRIAAQVVSGVGFLGAGAIIQSKGSIRGLTTAAGIWMTAMIGIAVGAGMHVVSLVVTMAILAMLTLLDRFEDSLHVAWTKKIIRLKVNVVLDDITPYKKLLEAHHIHLSESYLRYEYTTPTTIVNFMIRTNGTVDYVELFRQMAALMPETLSLTLTDEVNQ